MTSDLTSKEWATRARFEKIKAEMAKGIPGYSEFRFDWMHDALRELIDYCDALHAVEPGEAQSLRDGALERFRSRVVADLLRTRIPKRAAEPPSDFRDMRLTAIPWNELQFPPEICNWTIRQLFNKAIGAQNGNRFSFAFEEKYEADAAFEFIAALGDISRHSETKDAPPPPPQPPPKRVIGEYAPGFRPRDADETSEGQSS